MSALKDTLILLTKVKIIAKRAGIAPEDEVHLLAFLCIVAARAGLSVGYYATEAALFSADKLEMIHAGVITQREQWGECGEEAIACGLSALSSESADMEA